jgi:hypothetical protein
LRKTTACARAPRAKCRDRRKPAVRSQQEILGDYCKIGGPVLPKQQAVARLERRAIAGAIRRRINVA